MLDAGAIASGITTAEQIALQQTNPLYEKSYYQRGPSGTIVATNIPTHHQ